jgi:hypothetical protein
VTTNAAGVARLDGLTFGDYVATEQVPTGVSDDAVKEATVNANANCGGGNEATVSFHNTPLTDLTVSVNSQVNSGTASRPPAAARRPARTEWRPLACAERPPTKHGHLHDRDRP